MSYLQTKCNNIKTCIQPRERIVYRGYTQARIQKNIYTQAYADIIYNRDACLIRAKLQTFTSSVFSHLYSMSKNDDSLDGYVFIIKK